MKYNVHDNMMFDFVYEIALKKRRNLSLKIPKDKLPKHGSLFPNRISYRNVMGPL